METQEKSFRDLQEDERLKKLERHLKLIQIKRPTNLQPTSSDHTSFSNISSIHGDNPLSDFSFSTPSVTSSRAGSVILASSNNLRKKLSKNLRIGLKPRIATSSVFDQSMESKKLDKDRIMMPPPAAITNNEPQLAVDTGQKAQAIKTMTKPSFPQKYENKTHNIHSLHDALRLDSNAVVHSDATKKISNKNDISKQYARVFKNWIVRLNDHGQLIIRGRLESGEHARSKPVKKRLSATTVLSVLKHRYHLVGDIYDLREELPEYVRGKFFNGFPVDWENVRQIWQGYVASGFSLQFRWPRPMADSDDDLRSDITDLTVAHLKNTSVKPTSFVSISHPPQTAREIDRISNKVESHSQLEMVKNDSDISAIYSSANEDCNARAETSAVATNCKRITKKSSMALDNHLANESQSTSKNVQPNKSESSKYENIVPRWKIDVIIDNLMNKNCSKEYIEKIIRAIDCFNELLTMPLTNNVETTIDEGVSLNYNSNGQTDTTSNKIYNDIEKTEMLKNVDSPRMRHSKQAAVTLSSSYSVESFEESQEEPRSKHKTFICEQSVTSRENNLTNHTSTKSEQSIPSALQSKIFLNHSDVINREQNISSPARLTSPKYDVRPIQNKKSQDIATLPREEIVRKSTKPKLYKRKTIFDSADSDTEGPVSNKSRTALANNISIVNTSLQKTPRSKHQSVHVEKMKNGFVEGVSDAYCDSDISIIDVSVVPGVKPRILSIQKITDDLIKRNHQRETLCPDFSFSNDEKHDHSKANSPMPKSSGNLSNEKTLASPSVKLADQCTVRLNKITADQHNHSTRNCTPTKTDKKATGHQKSRIDSRSRITEELRSDAENVSMRMSSRGRRILPPLDYWNGERVSLKGRELVYSPGTSRTAFSSANSSTLKHGSSPNTTSISEPLPVSGSAKNLNKTPTAVESMNKNTRRIGGILSEISANHDENSDHEMISDRRVTRSVNNIQRDVKKSRRSRRINEKSDISSDDEPIPLVRNRKKRRIY